MAKAQTLTALKGMNDLFPPETARWEWLEEKVREQMARFAYQNVRLPILERTELFVRGIGEVTDVVEKEMYAFADRADKHGEFDHVSLRPEGTAGVVRAVTEQNLLRESPLRLWYCGPMFRRENVQRGRSRQFHQIGAEALGFAGPEVDAELILLATSLWQAIGLTNVRLELNSLGQPSERAAHRAELIAYLEAHADQLDEDATRRLHSNPLRILDTKNPAMQDLVNGAPKLMDFLGEESLAHFNALRAILDDCGVAYTLNPRLVRGLDYYNLTVFEFVTDQLGSQGTVCAGGRYDHLIEQIGGKPSPAVGWALGMERILELLKEQGQVFEAPSCDAYAVVQDATLMPLVLKTLQALRAQGVAVQMHASGAEGFGAMKKQFKRADASGARFALIFGGDEVAAGDVSIKALRGAAATDPEQQQRRVALADLAQWAPSLRA